MAATSPSTAGGVRSLARRKEAEGRRKRSLDFAAVDFLFFEIPVLDFLPVALNPAAVVSCSLQLI